MSLSTYNFGKKMNNYYGKDLQIVFVQLGIIESKKSMNKSQSVLLFTPLVTPKNFKV